MVTRLEHARRAAGLTQTALAQRAGVSQAFMSMEEAGYRPRSTRRLDALADALDLELPQILGLCEDDALIAGAR